MKHKLFTFLIVLSFVFSQGTDEDFSFETEIIVEKDEPRVSITLSRKLPEFPELPIKRDFIDEILNKFDNTVYYVQRRKTVIVANVEKEIISFN